MREFEAALRKAGRAESTIRARVGDIERLHEEVPDLKAATISDLENYLQPHWSAFHRRRTVDSFRIFYRWAHASGYIERDPAVRLIRIREPHRPPLPPAPLEVILRAFEEGSLHERAIIVLAATHGLRRSEIAGLHPRDRRGRDLHVTGKGAKTRVIPIDDLAYAILTALEAEQGEESYYLPGRFSGHLHPDTVYKWAKNLLGDWTLHSCRRRAATEAWASNQDVLALRDFLGHVNIDTGRYYVTVNKQSIEDMVQAASLGWADSVRRIAGLPQEERVDLDAKSRFLADLGSVTQRAREFGLEIALR